MEPVVAARWKLLAAALLFSTGGAAVKACGMTGWQVACFRSGVGAIALFALLPTARRCFSRRQALVGCTYAATLILYVLANKSTTASNAIFLQSTAPLFLLIIAPLALKERVRRRDLVFMAALALGLALFFAGTEAPQRTAPDPLLGNILAAASALTWALTVAGLRWIARTEGEQGGSRVGAAVGAAAIGNVIVFVVCLPFAWPVRVATITDWAWIAYLGVFQIGLAYVFMIGGVRRVPALEGALLLLVEPVLNTLWAWVFHGEIPGSWALAGALVILGATVVHALRRDTRRTARPPPAAAGHRSAGALADNAED